MSYSVSEIAALYAELEADVDRLVKRCVFRLQEVGAEPSAPSLFEGMRDQLYWATLDAIEKPDEKALMEAIERRLAKMEGNNGRD
jgi:hypothetical protein